MIPHQLPVIKSCSSPIRVNFTISGDYKFEQGSCSSLLRDLFTGYKIAFPFSCSPSPPAIMKLKIDVVAVLKIHLPAAED